MSASRAERNSGMTEIDSEGTDPPGDGCFLRFDFDNIVVGSATARAEPAVLAKPTHRTDNTKREP